MNNSVCKLLTSAKLKRDARGTYLLSEITKVTNQSKREKCVHVSHTGLQKSESLSHMDNIKLESEISENRQLYAKSDIIRSGIREKSLNVSHTGLKKCNSIASINNISIASDKIKTNISKFVMSYKFESSQRMVSVTGPHKVLQKSLSAASVRNNSKDYESQQSMYDVQGKTTTVCRKGVHKSPSLASLNDINRKKILSLPLRSLRHLKPAPRCLK